MKYDVPESQTEVLPNLLGIKTISEIALEEFEGFVKAEIQFTEELTLETKFNVSYILSIHKMALSHLYSFAGKYRDVNLSKGGFPFAAARFLPETMNTFEMEILSKLSNKHKNKDDLIKEIAIVHGELLFIHPFREGNGRTARILANLMCRKHNYAGLKFELITEEMYIAYIKAVQFAAKKNYNKMVELIQFIFPN